MDAFGGLVLLPAELLGAAGGCAGVLAGVLAGGCAVVLMAVFAGVFAGGFAGGFAGVVFGGVVGAIVPTVFGGVTGDAWPKAGCLILFAALLWFCSAMALLACDGQWGLAWPWWPCMAKVA
eukprot:s1312_g22.t1